MSNYVVWIVVGGALGLAVSRLVRRDTTPSRLLNIMAGVVGAASAGLAVTPLFALAPSTVPGANLLALLAAIGGAGLLLMVVNLSRTVR
jgi:uncharacterized membrane protein YeaQ/YmgE (transglycosylase-associated protein family)